MTLDECDRLFATVQKASSPAEACHALAPLFELYAVISIDLTRGDSEAERVPTDGILYRAAVRGLPQPRPFRLREDVRGPRLGRATNARAGGCAIARRDGSVSTMPDPR